MLKRIVLLFVFTFLLVLPSQPVSASIDPTAHSWGDFLNPTFEEDENGDIYYLDPNFFDSYNQKYDEFRERWDSYFEKEMSDFHQYLKDNWETYFSSRERTDELLDGNRERFIEFFKEHENDFDEFTERKLIHGKDRWNFEFDIRQWEKDARDQSNAVYDELKNDLDAYRKSRGFPDTGLSDDEKFNDPNRFNLLTDEEMFRLVNEQSKEHAPFRPIQPDIDCLVDKGYFDDMSGGVPLSCLRIDSDESMKAVDHITEKMLPELYEFMKENSEALKDTANRMKDKVYDFFSEKGQDLIDLFRNIGGNDK